MVANDAPTIDPEDSGLWRRVVRVPFDRVVPEGERDPDLKLNLKDPAIGGPAVLAWMVKGCLKWQSLGKRIPKPERVQIATKQYQAEQDGLSNFLAEVCVTGPDEMVPVLAMAEAFEAYWQSFGRSNRERHLTKRQLTEALSKRDFDREKRMYGEGSQRKQQHVWLGIAVKPDLDGDD